jgi:hypothetical protein
MSDMGTVNTVAFSEPGGGGNASQAAQKKANEIISPRTPPQGGFDSVCVGGGGERERSFIDNQEVTEGRWSKH